MIRGATKRFALGLAGLFSTLWRVVPALVRKKVFFGMFVLESRQRDPAEGLRRLLEIKDKLDLTINERAMAYGKAEHPKHRLTRYHDFFVNRITDGERVLDIGCGYGAVARSIARAHSNSVVVGVDQDVPRLTQARSSENPENLRFHEGDATKSVPEGPWDVVVLSNVLEHIHDRVGLLVALQTSTHAARYLIRVPLFERDWQMALRRELGVDFRSDDDHKIEHTLAEFQAEAEQAGLVIDHMATLWGEIWAECSLASPQVIAR
ncbi:class I SAM-dependent methyltransferase [Nitrogeniibacter aestuarii]|uniref:class I SAM-dependent methyltransferase n=1 Tax=Nitrogeniibacter aestuarii TaxID=2815343 RepID=UPI001D11BF99|nr:class I SAM-dependent methyltransferase [Nitrogeniibacter aestuarii]